MCIPTFFKETPLFEKVKGAPHTIILYPCLCTFLHYHPYLFLYDTDANCCCISTFECSAVKCGLSNR